MRSIVDIVVVAERLEAPVGPGPELLVEPAFAELARIAAASSAKVSSAAFERWDSHSFACSDSLALQEHLAVAAAVESYSLAVRFPSAIAKAVVHRERCTASFALFVVTGPDNMQTAAHSEVVEVWAPGH